MYRVIFYKFVHEQSVKKWEEIVNSTKQADEFIEIYKDLFRERYPGKMMDFVFDVKKA